LLLPESIFSRLSKKKREKQEKNQRTLPADQVYKIACFQKLPMPGRENFNANDKK
jgi:hypothetical protein